MADGLDNNTLKLLMDSYREQVQLNTKLLERQERFIDRLDNSTHNLIEAINAQTTGLQANLAKGITGMCDRMSEEHGQINLRIYAAIGGMVSILVTLLTIWITQ
jgi:hypothetical protein